MKLLILIGLCLAGVQAATIEQDGQVDPRVFNVCYDDLGCYTNLPPFGGTLQRPIALLPQSPDRINPTFNLYTKSNPSTPAYLKHTALDPLFDVSRPTKFIIHGFVDTGFTKHFQDMKDALLSVGDFNVVIVDWSKGNGLPYTQATANTQVVGALIARLVNTYAKNYGLNVNDVHIIGHSLGAHTAGYAGAKIPGLGRITGLDPAGPYFEGSDKVVRLDEGDAKFVDIIHSDGAPTLAVGLGLMQKSGHVDFYVNGGRDQPNCDKTADKILHAILNIGGVIVGDYDGILATSACSHMAAVYFFTDTIRNADCKYTAFPCASYSEFEKGNCLSCKATGTCNEMGFWASQSKDQGSLFLNTQGADKLPYCEYPYSARLNSNSIFGQIQAKGAIEITLNGEKSATTLYFDKAIVTFTPGSSVKKLMPSTRYIGESIQSAVVSYKKTTDLLTGWLYQDQWSFKNLQITYGNNQKTVTLCPDQTWIKSGSSVNFRLC